MLVTLAGDLHHYRRHESTGNLTTHKITAGGGGSFLHPTHGQKVDQIDVGSKDGLAQFVQKAEFPECQKSKKLAFKNILFPLINPRFGLVTGFAYLMVAWVLHGELREYFQAIPIRLGNIPEICLITLRELAKDPSGIAWVAAIFLGFVFFTDTHKKVFKYAAGSFHASSHLFINLMIGWFITRTVIHSFSLPPESLSQMTVSGLGVFLSGYILGSLVMGLYLLVSLSLFGRHSNEAFSSLKIQDYKNFLRLHIDSNGRLTIYPFGIRCVPREWVAAQNPGNDDPKLVPKGKKGIEVCLIEEPIEVA